MVFNHNLMLNFNEANYTAFSQDDRTQSITNEIKMHGQNCNPKNNSCGIIKKIESVKYLGNIID